MYACSGLVAIVSLGLDEMITHERKELLIVLITSTQLIVSINLTELSHYGEETFDTISVKSCEMILTNITDY